MPEAGKGKGTCFRMRTVREEAHKALREENAMFLTVIEEGDYTELYLKRLGGMHLSFPPRS
jgi:hypothetical protein